MSVQNSLIVRADDINVVRPKSDADWQMFRRNQAAGAGTYHAMNKDGVVENFNGAGNDNISVDIVNDGANAFSAIVSPNATLPVSYNWDISQQVGTQVGVFFEINNGATVLMPVVDIILNTPPDQPTSQYSIMNNAINAGLVKLTITDANGKIARDYRMVFFIP